MPHQPHYSPMARQLFGQFLDQEIDRDNLIGRLQEMELQLQADADEENEDEDEIESTRSLRIRIFGGDTLGMSISEIEQDLQEPTHPNAQILMRGIAFGLAEDELEVHYE
ncbi:hypothetical protein [Pontibacter virosus]|uniref:Uncharacterized protein n=1 Tax=Pontibacter virosus TaxID=1765052 RepID=A0A2U1AUY2_9BACT|nr:hypothetical protein [Pontibacter virosus]PVY40234.1 hypothetical protein C8E01_108128 [Pontibacter virosus]